jgi:diguanylate cyclase (GGDEF)-like protein
MLAAAAWLGFCALDGMPALGSLDDGAGRSLIFMLLASALVFMVHGALAGRREACLLEANERLDALSVTDATTGLRNLRYFRARLEEAYARAERERQPLAVAIIDLDRFKSVNDRFGHLVGDEVLLATARAIGKVVRRGETAARVGGEEFALLLPGSDSASAEIAAERVRRAIAATKVRVRGGQETVVVTGSVGLASTTELGYAGAGALYAAADEALYRAKRAGRDRIHLAGELPAFYEPTPTPTPDLPDPSLSRITAE